VIHDRKLRVVYIPPSSTQGNSEDERLKGSTQSPDANSVSYIVFVGVVILAHHHGLVCTHNSGV
jgi:hypothetical protein